MFSPNIIEIFSWPWSVFFLICLISVCSAPFQAHAYFHSQSNQIANHFTLSGLKVQSEVDPSCLSLYSDLNTLSGNDEKSSFFDSHSSYRTSVLKISLNMPLVITEKTQITSFDLSLKNLLYADIKLQKLVQEYRRLQERSRELVQGYNELHSHPSDGGKKVGGNEESSKRYWSRSVQDHKKALMRWKEHDIRSIVSLLHSRQDMRKFDALLGDNLAALDTHVQKLITLYSQNVSGKDSSKQHQFSKPRSLTKAQDVKVRIDPFQQEMELPWFFKKALDFIQYVFENKVQFVLIGVTIFTCFGLIMASQKS